MTGAAGDDPAPRRAAVESEIADQIEELVVRRFVLAKGEGSLEHALVRQHDDGSRINAMGPARRSQSFCFTQETEGARRRDALAKVRRIASEARCLPPDEWMVELDRGLERDLFGRLEDVDRLAMPERRRLRDHERGGFGRDGQVGERIEETRGPSVEERKLRAIDADEQIASNPERGRRCEQMFDEVHADASPCERHPSIRSRHLELVEPRLVIALNNRERPFASPQGHARFAPRMEREAAQDHLVQAHPFAEKSPAQFPPEEGMSLKMVTAAMRASIITSPTAWICASILGFGLRRVVAS